MSDPWTDAWEEAEATNPPLDVYETLELVHPAFTDDGGVTTFPIRIVAGTPNDTTLTLEEGAPLNGGQAVVWTACDFMADKPEFSDQKLPQFSLAIDNVAQLVSPYLENAVGIKANLELTYRQYRSDDITEPCYGPVTFQMKNVVMVGTRLTGTAMIDDLNNRVMPNLDYNLTNFPGLLANA